MEEALSAAEDCGAPVWDGAEVSVGLDVIQCAAAFAGAPAVVEFSTGNWDGSTEEAAAAASLEHSGAEEAGIAGVDGAERNHAPIFLNIRPSLTALQYRIV